MRREGSSRDLSPFEDLQRPSACRFFLQVLGNDSRLDVIEKRFLGSGRKLRELLKADTVGQGGEVDNGFFRRLTESDQELFARDL